MKEVFFEGLPNQTGIWPSTYNLISVNVEVLLGDRGFGYIQIAVLLGGFYIHQQISASIN